MDYRLLLEAANGTCRAISSGKPQDVIDEWMDALIDTWRTGP